MPEGMIRPIFTTYSARLLPRFAALLSCMMLFLVPSWSSETDQYMAWGIEMKDGAPALNRYLNEEFEVYLALVNADEVLRTQSKESTAVGYYKYIFKHLLSSRLRKWMRESPELESYPDRSEVSVCQYQNRSVMRGRSFPYYLPMARTVRMGDVYLGTDKISHMLGFGRRYFKHYRNLRKDGIGDEEARRRTVRWGLRREKIIVGRVVSGIMSFGDLEANYQGMLLLSALASEDSPYLEHVDGQWRALAPIDILEYITPDMDESYNNSYYWALRKRFTIPVLLSEYGERYYSPEVQARFDIYRTYEPSLSSQVLDEFYASRKRNPQQLQSIPVLMGREP